VNGEITNSELARRIDAMARDMREDMKDISTRLDQHVLRAVYLAEQSARDARLNGLEVRAKESEELRRSLVRYVWGSVAIPLAALIMAVVLSLRGH
jgi:heme exporter protein D